VRRWRPILTARCLPTKSEEDSARLDDFELRLRARTMQKLAGFAGGTRADMTRAVAAADDEGVLADLLARAPELEEAKLRDAYRLARAEARAELLDECGDPAPHRPA
jgi:hypothetical protein